MGNRTNYKNEKICFNCKYATSFNGGDLTKEPCRTCYQNPYCEWEYNENFDFKKWKKKIHGIATS